MSEMSAAYMLAQHIHDTVWQRNNLLSTSALKGRRIYATRGHMTNTEQVVAFGDHNSLEPAFETLTKARNGLFYFEATLGSEFTGDMSLGRHVISPNSGEGHALRLASSMLVQELAHIAVELADR